MCGIVYLEDQLEAAHGAGYCDGFAGDVVGVFRGEECDGSCDVFGFTESAEWDDADACVDMFPGFESELFLADCEIDGCVEWGVDDAGGYGVDPYRVLGESCSGDCGEVDESCFCCGVGRRRSWTAKRSGD